MPLVTPEELLAGSELVHDVVVPSELLQPGVNDSVAHRDAPTEPSKVRLRPLTVKDAQLIARAAKDDDVLTSILMIERSLIEPRLGRDQIAKLHGGLVRYLVDAIDQVSGLTTTKDDIAQFTESPLVQAFFVLTKEFGWTPQQIRELTLGQIIEYLELLNHERQAASTNDGAPSGVP